MLAGLSLGNCNNILPAEPSPALRLHRWIPVGPIFRARTSLESSTVGSLAPSLGHSNKTRSRPAGGTRSPPRAASAGSAAARGMLGLPRALLAEQGGFGTPIPLPVGAAQRHNSAHRQPAVPLASGCGRRGSAAGPWDGWHCGCLQPAGLAALALSPDPAVQTAGFSRGDLPKGTKEKRLVKFLHSSLSSFTAGS